VEKYSTVVRYSFQLQTSKHAVTNLQWSVYVSADIVSQRISDETKPKFLLMLRRERERGAGEVLLEKGKAVLISAVLMNLL
jgi:hypothetical protein